MDRSEMIYAFLMANIRNEAEEVDRLLEVMTEELDSGGCFDMAEVQAAMVLTQDELVDFDEDEDVGADADEEEAEHIQFREDDGDDWNSSSASSDDMCEAAE